MPSNELIQEFGLSAKAGDFQLTRDGRKTEDANTWLSQREGERFSWLEGRFHQSRCAGPAVDPHAFAISGKRCFGWPCFAPHLNMRDPHRTTVLSCKERTESNMRSDCKKLQTDCSA